jgi:hypothetical protein
MRADVKATTSDSRREAEQSVCEPGALCGPRALFGWSPQALPADTPFKRRTDRLLVGYAPAIIMIALVLTLGNIAPHLPVRAALAVEGLAALVGGGWCSVNFWRCRHAHCLVTGTGWLALSLVLFAESALGRSLMAGYEPMVFNGVLVAALIFEGGWFLARRTNAVTLATHAGAAPDLERW